jgi:electron transfer flavoprotein beta subunit
VVKAAVLVKQVPNTEEVRIDDSTREPDASRAERVISLYDKNAIEAAVQLTEDGEVNEVVAISVGDDDTEESLREVLAMGADEAFLVNAPELLDGGVLAKNEALALAVEEVGDVDLVFASEESADSLSASTGPMVTEFLNAQLLSYAFDVDLDDGSVVVQREIDEGHETLRAPMPAVITVVEGINDPRLPALTEILQAKNKPLTEVTAADLGIEADVTVEIVENKAPEETRKKEIQEVDDVDEAADWLIENLQSEGLI